MMDQGTAYTDSDKDVASPKLDGSETFFDGKYLKTLLKNTLDNFIILDRNGYVVHCSEAFIRLAGIENYELIRGRHFREMYGLLEKDLFCKRAERRFQKTQASENPLYMFQIIPLTDDDGTFKGAQVLFHDTTGRTSAENEERTRVMLDAMPFACTFWDTGFEPVDCNRKAVELFECKSRQEYLENFFRLSPEYQPDGMLSPEKLKILLRETRESGSRIVRWEHLTMSGKALPVETYLVRVEWRDGWRIVGYVRDMREIQTKEIQVQEAEERTSLVLDATPLACSLWDEEGNILDYNQESVHLFGFTEKDSNFDRAAFLELIPKYQPDGKLSVTLMDEATRTAIRYGYTLFEWVCLSNTGELLPLETTLVRIPWKDKYRILAYSSDMRKLRAIEEEAIKADADHAGCDATGLHASG